MTCLTSIVQSSKKSIFVVYIVLLVCVCTYCRKEFPSWGEILTIYLSILTGNAEAKDTVIFLHELLQQSALPCPGRAANHHRPGSSHSWKRGGDRVQHWKQVGEAGGFTRSHWNLMAWVTIGPNLFVHNTHGFKKISLHHSVKVLRQYSLWWDKRHKMISQQFLKGGKNDGNISHKSKGNQRVGKPGGYHGAATITD